MFNSHGGASVGRAYPTLHLGVRELFDQGYKSSTGRLFRAAVLVISRTA